MTKRILAILFAVLSFNSATLMAQPAPPGARIHVYKVYQGYVETDDPSILEVEVQLSCNGGDDLVQVGTLQPDGTLTFNVNNFAEGETDCEVTEISGHEDFFPVYEGASGDSPPPPDANFEIFDAFDEYPFESDDESCQFNDITSGDYTCRIHNIPKSADFTINKTWEFGSSGDTGGIVPEYGIGLLCLGGWQVEQDSTPPIIFNEIFFVFPISFSIWPSDSTDDETYETEVVPFLNLYFDDGPEKVGSLCFPFEETFDSRVEVSSDCRLATEDVIGGFEEFFEIASEEQFVPPNSSHECNLVNTIFFEGIPTLNQYGIALMALLMLGLGFVGMRRLA